MGLRQISGLPFQCAKNELIFVVNPPSSLPMITI